MMAGYILTTALLFASSAMAFPQASTAPDAAPSATPTPTTTGTDGVSPSESSAFSSALRSYITSLQNSPQVSNLVANLYVVDDGAVAALQSDPAQLLPFDPAATTVDIRSLATAPPLSFSSLAFYSDIPPQLVSNIQSMQTSAALEVARLGQSVLRTSAGLPDPTSSSSSTGAAGLAVARPTGLAAVGAAVGALGVAVAAL